LKLNKRHFELSQLIDNQLFVAIHHSSFIIHPYLFYATMNLSRFGLILLLPLFFVGFKPDVAPQYLQVQLTKPLTINDLLTEYHLSKDDCTIQQFLKINQLKKVESLPKGKKYALPILLFAFDGKTIRSSVKIQDIDFAKRIQTYNIDLVRNKIRSKSYQDTRILWVPYSWLHCKTGQKTSPESYNNANTVKKAVVSGPEAPKKANIYKIFGKKYEEVPMKGASLKGKIFYIESGHGGPDPGAMFKKDGRTMCEDEYAYDVSLRVARLLIAHGGTVFIITRDPNDGIRDGQMLTCDADERTFPDLKIPAAHRPRLYQRSDAINSLYDKYKKEGITDQRCLILHVDSRVKTLQTDIYLYYQSSSTVSKKIGQNILENLKDNHEGKRKYRGTLSSRDLHMMRESKVPTVYVEMGNLRNTVDLERIRTGAHRQEVADWLYEGFIQ
jgi:N-acetylmuramoyl-L-alanine amidase